MKIIAFIKQVPEADDVRLDEKTGNLKRDGIRSVINPVDKNVLEAALRLRDENGGTVTAVTMGPPQAEDVLRRALFMGCDEVRLLSDRAFAGADTLATGYTLAMAARKIGGFDLLLFGKNAADAETGQTGPIAAEFLGLPQVTLVTDIAVRDGWAYCTRQLPDRTEKLRVRLPALITVCKETNTPRFQTPGNVIEGLKKPRTVWSAADLGCDPAQIGTAGSPSRTKAVFAPPARSTDTEMFSGGTEELAEAFVDMLRREHLI